jgi:hypothetical protein
MANDDLAQTLDELLAFVDDRRLKRALPDGRELVWGLTRRLTGEEMDHLFVLDLTAGVQAGERGLRLPALPPCARPGESHLPHTRLRYQCGPGLTLHPTREWFAEIRAIRAVAKAVAEGAVAAAPPVAPAGPPAEEDWMPARKAVERANREGVAITLPTVSKWKANGMPGLKTRGPTRPGRHRWEVEYNSLVIVCHQRAVESGNAEPCEGSFDARIEGATAAHRRCPD